MKQCSIIRNEIAQLIICLSLFIYQKDQTSADQKLKEEFVKLIFETNEQIEKTKNEKEETKTKQSDEQSKECEQISEELDWEQLEIEIENEKKVPKQSESQKHPHKFVHFYTATLLENDHRINYHWHIEDHIMQDSIKQLSASCQNIENFITGYRSIIEDDDLVKELAKLLQI